MTRNADQDRFLATLLGMAIGDAMAMPFAGRRADELARSAPTIDGYFPRQLGDGVEIGAGEFTDETEIALCIVETATANGGHVDPDNVLARMRMLARGESKRWIPTDTLHAIIASEESLDIAVPLDEDGPATGDVASRGIPIGLLHAVGRFDPPSFAADVETVTRLTHGSPLAISSVFAVAFGIRLAATDTASLGEIAAVTAGSMSGGSVARALERLARSCSDAVPGALEDSDDAASVVASAFAAAGAATSLLDAIQRAIAFGGATDSRAAIAGALFAAAHGVASVPQRLIDGLEGRIYISLAAPWFYRAAMRRAGLVIDFREAI